MNWGCLTRWQRHARLDDQENNPLKSSPLTKEFAMAKLSKNTLRASAMSPKDYFSMLVQKPYIHVDFPLNRSELEDAIASFFQFLEQPSDTKEHIDFKVAPRHRRGDIGYRRRDPEGDIYNDAKEFFHFHPAIFQKYEDFLSNNPLVNQFMMKAQRVWESAYGVVSNILQSFDSPFPGTSSKVFATDEPHVMLRFLRYDWQQSGEYLAKPHFDSGSFTLAIAESGPGLRIGRSPLDLEIIEHRENQAVFMLSSNFRKIIDTEILSAGWHDVVQLDDSKIGKPFARWAIVAFFEGIDVEALPRTETHKWHH